MLHVSGYSPTLPAECINSVIDQVGDFIWILLPVRKDPFVFQPLLSYPPHILCVDVNTY